MIKEDLSPRRSPYRRQKSEGMTKGSKSDKDGENWVNPPLFSSTLYEGPIGVVLTEAFGSKRSPVGNEALGSSRDGRQFAPISLLLLGSCVPTPPPISLVLVGSCVVTPPIILPWRVQFRSSCFVENDGLRPLLLLTIFKRKQINFKYV